MVASITAQATRSNFVTPAYNAFVDSAPDHVLDTIFTTQERHRLLGGKSARLLRKGDTVALCDLTTVGGEHVGRSYDNALSLNAKMARNSTAVIFDTVIASTGDVFVITQDQGAYKVPGHRLMLTFRI